MSRHPLAKDRTHCACCAVVAPSIVDRTGKGKRFTAATANRNFRLRKRGADARSSSRGRLPDPRARNHCIEAGASSRAGPVRHVRPRPTSSAAMSEGACHRKISADAKAGRRSRIASVPCLRSGRDRTFGSRELRRRGNQECRSLGHPNEDEKPLVPRFHSPYTDRRRRGRVVEGTPLLRVQARKGLEGSNPFVSATSLFQVVAFLSVSGPYGPRGSDRGSIASL